MSDKLTTKEDWEDYWGHHVPARIESTYLDEFINESSRGASLIEVGGFPGNFAGYYKKRLGCDVSILDYVDDHKLVHKVEKSYGLHAESIKIIETDFFDYDSLDQYDIVMSIGFIEHFDDTELVIQKHAKLVKSGGKLLITLPNFRGINGMVQKYLDPQNYAKHNIRSMDVGLLRDIMTRMGLNSFSVNYHGVPHLWLEPSAAVSSSVRFIIRCISKIMRATKKCPLSKSKLLAPYIVVHGEK